MERRRVAWPVGGFSRWRSTFPCMLLVDAVRTDGMLRGGADDVASAYRDSATVARLEQPLEDVEAAIGLPVHPARMWIVAAAAKDRLEELPVAAPRALRDGGADVHLRLGGVGGLCPRLQAGHAPSLGGAVLRAVCLFDLGLCCADRTGCRVSLCVAEPR